jgi:hypothetical protein
MVCVVVLVAMAGCSNPSNDDVGGSSSGQDNPGGSFYAETYWGEWVRMDEEETWYISGGAIKINGAASSKSVSLAKQSDRVIEVAEGERKYYLYASRIANTSFSGKISSFEEILPSASVSASASLPILRAAGWIHTVKTGVEAKVTNQNNGSTQTVQTDSEGVFTVEGVIPGDTYEITPVTPEGETPVSVTVTPQGDGDDVGTITVTEGVNFKTGIRRSVGYNYISQDVLYAGTIYNFTLSVTNMGTEDCEAATYHLGFEDGLITSASTAEDVFQTIGPGETRSLSLSLKCGPIEEVYADKKISITITDQLSKKTWEDSVSVRFYRGTVPFYVRAEKRINGIIISPQNQTYRFSGTDTSVTVPWVPGEYLVVFSGADADMQT